MKILVCGDRRWKDDALVWEWLDKLQPNIVIDGHAYGADQAAHRWADYYCVASQCFPAEWNKYGRAAGPIRNRQMAKLEPDLVLAFHDRIETSKGTGDMLTVAEDVGICYSLVSHEQG